MVNIETEQKNFNKIGNIPIIPQNNRPTIEMEIPSGPHLLMVVISKFTGFSRILGLSKQKQNKNYRIVHVPTIKPHSSAFIRIYSYL